MQFDSPFNPEGIPDADFEPVPAGEYAVAVVASERKETKAGDGAYLQLEMQILGDGPGKGRKLWDRLNLYNKNQQAVDIAHRQLASLCRAVGVGNLTDSTQLHNVPVLVRVRVRAATPEFDAQNEVKGYKPIPKPEQPGQPTQAQETTVKAQPAQAPANPSTTGTGGVTPW